MSSSLKMLSSISTDWTLLAALNSRLPTSRYYESWDAFALLFEANNCFASLLDPKFASSFFSYIKQSCKSEFVPDDDLLWAARVFYWPHYGTFRVSPSNEALQFLVCLYLCLPWVLVICCIPTTSWLSTFVSFFIILYVFNIFCGIFAWYFGSMATKLGA